MVTGMTGYQRPLPQSESTSVFTGVWRPIFSKIKIRISNCKVLTCRGFRFLGCRSVWFRGLLASVQDVWFVGGKV